MNAAVMLSIHPQWCEPIARGRKPLEIRKTRPKLETPFKTYIYCTKDSRNQFWINERYQYVDDHSHNLFDRCGNGKVIGEFVCDDCSRLTKAHYARIEKYGLLSREALNAYMGLEGCDLSYEDGCYGWHISKLVIYDTPRELIEFRRVCQNDLYCERCSMFLNETEKCGDKALYLTKPPVSWCYVEDRISDLTRVVTRAVSIAAQIPLEILRGGKNNG